jgi:periplasmic divalent cation tolerance protein
MLMYQLILCTCPNHQTAERIAEELVMNKLAACVNILPGVKSVYQWQGAIETAQEHLLLIKTLKQKFSVIEASIKSYHPYEIPEIIATTIESGSPEYLNWINACLCSH